MSEKCACGKRKIRSAEEYKLLVNRLKRVEGQVRGVISMVEESAYCVDILTQVSAIKSALNSFCKELLESHIKSCVVEDIKAGKEETADELVEVIGRFIK